MPIFYTDSGSITNLTVASLDATGSLQGTASFATTAQNLLGSVTTASTASFVTASGVYGPYGANSVVSASFAVSASWAPGGGGGTTFAAGNINNRVITATGTTPELNGESNLTFDGSTLAVTGNVTANSFTGSLQGTASFAVSASWAPGGGGVTINNNTDNYLVTATGTAATLNGESNATFDGSTLAVTGNVTANSFTGSLQGTASFALTASYALNSTPSAGTDFGKVIAITQTMYPFSGF
jgi:hypothetical protein